MVDGKLVGNPGAHMPSTAPPSLVRFADFEVDVRAGQLRQNGVRIHLQDQPFRLLAALLESGGEPFSLVAGGNVRGFRPSSRGRCQ
jgi:DNA-binding response OmpR family regulator